MNFIMTGHRGLIGNFLLERLNQRGDIPALLIDKREGKDLSMLKEVTLSEKVDVFMHLAAFCKVNETIRDPVLAFENNVKGTFEVMEFCRKNSIPKVVFVSSSRVLSKEKNPYTASKLYGEEIVKGYQQAYGLDYVIIRPSTVYGPFDDLTHRLVDIFITRALTKKELMIFGTPEKTLDFTYVDDFVNGFLIALKQKNKEFNIASGIGTKVSYVADLIIQLAGGGTKGFYPPEIAQPQEVTVDISAITQLGYNPIFSIEEGIKRTFEWYKAYFYAQL